MRLQDNPRFLPNGGDSVSLLSAYPLHPCIACVIGRARPLSGIRRVDTLTIFARGFSLFGMGKSSGTKVKKVLKVPVVH